MAGERWDREDAAKKLREDEEQGDVPREQRRALPRHGRGKRHHNPNLGGEHT
jgi:hypothetical protein